MTNKSRRKQVLMGTLLLTVSSFIAKLLSAVYRIPFQNMVGNIGFYVYQQVYPIYGIGMTFALTGLPVFISKLVVDTKNPSDQVAVVYRIQTILILISAIIFGVLQFGASFIAFQMADPRLAPVIKSVSWMFLWVPFLATWRGYFQGQMNMRPTAYSQVVEQVVRVSFILLVAGWSVKSVVDPYRMGRLAMFSAPIAGLCALLVVLWHVKQVGLPHSSHRKVYRHLLIKTLTVGGTLCLVSAVMLLLQLVDSFSIVSGLREYGYQLVAAQNIKGIYDRSQTLVQLGMVIGTASVTAVLPSLSVAYAHQQALTFEHIAKTNVRTNLALSLAMSIGLFTLMPEINRVLFATAQLNGTIGVYCLSIIFATVLLTNSTILQSRNQYLPTMIAIICGFVTKIGINKFLVIIFGIIGASIATMISLIVMIVVIRLLSHHQLAKMISLKQIIKLAGVLSVMAVIVRSIAILLQSFQLIKSDRIESLIVLVVCIPVGIIIFLGGCRLLQVFSLREWLAIPMVSKFMKFKGMK
ncbi:MAG: oligosaccharide flippase family protein [Lentilactobacillus diolivorans]